MFTIKAALAGTLVYAAAATAALAEPKTNMLHQWSEGSDAAAIAKLGEMFTAAGGNGSRRRSPDTRPIHWPSFAPMSLRATRPPRFSSRGPRSPNGTRRA